MNNTTNLPGTSKIKRHFLFLGYAIIQIPDFLINAYAYIERWLRSRTISDHNSDLPTNTLGRETLPKKNANTVSRIPIQEQDITKQTQSQKETLAYDEKIAELSEKTNARFERLERILEEINIKLEN